MSDADLAAALSRPLHSVDDVVATMQAIGALLPAPDGVACFNRLYLEMTRHVASAVGAATFEDPGFMVRLDLIFAGRYFDAILRDLKTPGSASRAWNALLESRARRPMHPLRFAVCGMNAHIAYDLAKAIVQATGEMGGDVSFGSARHRDFEKINQVLANTEAAVKKSFLDACLSEVDAALGSLDDRTVLWSISAAREAAWNNASLLWMARDTPLASTFETTIDRSVGLVGRLIVV